MGKGVVRRNLPIAALGAAAFGLGAGAVMLGNGEAVVERGFQRAIANLDDGARKPRPVIAGSEEFWLTHVVHQTDPAIAKPVAVGDRITITSNGAERVLNVVDIDRLSSQILPITSERPTPLLLVTCRDAAEPGARPVRFLIEADDQLPGAPASNGERRPMKVAPAA